MKTIQHTVTLSLALLAATATLAADTYSKDWSNSYKVSPDAAFGLTHKYGDVTITTWDQSVIQVDFHVELESGNESKAQKILDAITVKEKSISASEVMLQTVFDGGYKDLDDLELTYTIKVPKGIALTLSNHFGDAFVPSLTASAVLDIQYGGLRAESLSGNANDVKLAFGSGEIDALMGGKLDVSYSTLEVDELGNVDVQCSFSAVDIDHAAAVKMRSSYDAFDIDHIASLDVKANFSSFEIDRLETALDADIQYGGLEIGGISKAFSHIRVDAQFTEVELEFSSGASYELDAFSHFGDIDYPSSLKVHSSEHDGMKKSVKGTMGTSPGDRLVKVTSKQGNVEIE